MKEKASNGRKLFVVANTVLLSLIGFFCLAPMLHVLSCSLSDPMTLAREKTFLLWPLGQWDFSGYAAILSYKNILVGYSNTLFYVIIGTAMNLVLTSVAAYVLSRKRFILSNPIMMLVSFTMLFNGGMIPNYMLVQKLGLLDSYWSVLLPGAMSVFNLIIMRTSFREIPDALEESARLDGANELQILIRIILPVSKATLAVIALFVAVMFWNSWFTASIYISDRNKWPLQLFLREILISNSQRTLDSDVRSSVLAQQSLIKYCTIIVATLPILTLYPFLQRYFVKGVMIGAIKG
jgi:putative aldouronate transport system permease protein